MKLKSVSAIVFTVNDLEPMVAFYESLGFRMDKHEKDYAKAYLNWFWLEFEVAKHGAVDNVGNSFAISVEDVDGYYDQFVKDKLKPETAVVKHSSGRRQFTIRDPEGNRLLFFEKK